MMCTLSMTVFEGIYEQKARIYIRKVLSGFNYGDCAVKKRKLLVPTTLVKRDFEKKMDIISFASVIIVVFAIGI